MIWRGLDLFLKSGDGRVGVVCTFSTTDGTGTFLWIPRYRPPPRRARQYHLPHPQHAEPPFPIAYSRIPSRTPPPVFPLATRSFPIAGVALVASSCAPSDRAHRSTSLTGRPTPLKDCSHAA
ncbi:hypothetical protein B0H13DRAFT_2320045 [Mycena leptocephala]|nr:hypothetical protein B0H13DRAFT_2320045 [Mycena leptocephala]